MAITCKWETVVGKLKYLPTGDELIMYGGGNVFACICKDDRNENNELYHALFDFICDKDHLERILSGINHYEDYAEIRLNSKYKEIWPIAKVLAKHGYDVTITTNDKLNCPF